MADPYTGPTYTGPLQNGAVPMPSYSNTGPAFGGSTTVAPPNVSASGAGGGFFQGGSLPLVTTAQTTQQAVPNFYMDYLNNLAKAGTAGGGAEFAGASPLQTQAFDLAAGTPGAWKPAMNMGMNYLGNVANYDPTKASAGALGSALGKDAMAAANPYLESAANPTYNTVGNYMSPYINSVVNAIGTLGQQNILQNVAPQTTAGVVGAGQFGSQRGAQALGQTLNQAALGITGQQAQALNTGYQSAMQQAQQQAQLQQQIGATAGTLTNAQQQNLANIGQIQGNLTSQQQQNLINAASTGGNLASQTGTLAWNDVTGLMNAGNVQQQLNQAAQLFPLQVAQQQAQILRGYNVPVSSGRMDTAPGQAGQFANSPLTNIAGVASLLASPNWGKIGQNLSNLFGPSNDYSTTAEAIKNYGYGNVYGPGGGGVIPTDITDYSDLGG